MKTLIIGIGALGGLIAARLLAAGIPVHLAARNAESAAKLRSTGLHLKSLTEEIVVHTSLVAPLDAYSPIHHFDLVLLATKAQDAFRLAPQLPGLLAPAGVILPIQNGGVSQLLAEQLGARNVVGGLSNFGGTMHSPGYYEQRNAGHLLLGELSGGLTSRVEEIAGFLGAGVNTRITPNLPGAIWSKLLLNCSVTTLGAIAGQTMREYLPHARDLFTRTYDEALAVARATGVSPERMLVDPIPPSTFHDVWLTQILDNYGDIKSSMLQDFERRRPTEIDFINGYVAELGGQLRVPTPINTAITHTVHAIERGELLPAPSILQHLWHSTGG